MADSNRIGQLFGNYRLVRLLGEGGFAEVYLGEHIHLGILAAVKVLHTKFITREQEEFLREARTIAFLEHPSIIRILDCGVEPIRGEPFLVMAYAPNGTLRQRHPKGTYLPIETIVPYVKQMASALQYAHEHRLVHRDVKPENMLLGPRSEVLLSDFGIALISSSSSSQNTATAAGTVAYMAPEQIMGKPRPASDQYALAVVTYEWLSGITPFYGSFPEMCAQHLYAPPPSLREMMPELAPEIEQTILKALAKDPQERFLTIEDFALTLEQSAQAQTSYPQIISPLVTRVLEDPATPTNPTLGAERSASESSEETLVKKAASGELLESPLASEAVRAEEKQELVAQYTNDELTQKKARGLASTGDEVTFVKATSSPPSIDAPHIAVLALPKRRGPQRGLILVASLLLALLITSVIIYTSFSASSAGQLANNAPKPTRVSLLPTPASGATPTPLLPTPTPLPVQRQISAVKTALETVQATGKATIPGKSASGSVTFVPHGAPPTTYPAGTSFTLHKGKDDIDIIIDEDVYLPYVQADDPNDYSVTVPAHVKQVGTIGNINAHALDQNCCRGSDHLYNASAFSGGTDAQQYVFVKQKDIKDAASVLTSSSTQQATESIQEHIRPNEHLIGSSQCTTQTSANHAAGDKASTVTVTATTTCVATVST